MKILFTAITAMTIASLTLQRAREHPTPKIVRESAFTVVGISARTTNAKEMSGQGVIAKLWQRVTSEQLLQKIPNRTDSNTLALYSNYQSDASGPYTFIIGARVGSAAKIPPGMIAVTVPAAKYAVFISARGPADKVVPETWRQIWLLPRSALGGDRAYQTDFELYDLRAASPQSAQVQIYVGIE